MLEVNPFERMNWLAHGRSEDSIAYRVVFKHEMWWFQIRTQVIAKYVPSLLEYLSMQAGFSGAPVGHGGFQQIEQVISQVEDYDS
jgi:hypothetical protein